jgi:Zn-dependent metalloprotease
MGGYVVTTDDDGGVHINSGIPNKAFYEAAVALDENSWEKLGKIWYTSLLESKSKFQFKDFADKTVDVAIRFFGKGGKEEAAVRKGWTVTEVYK